jgi:hypothetical protein
LVVLPLNALMLKDSFAEGDVSSLAEKLGFKDIFITLHDILFLYYYLRLVIEKCKNALNSIVSMNSFVLLDLDVFNEPFYDFFVSMVIILDVFVELFAQGQVLGLQLFLGLPPRVRVDPILNAFDLIARCQVYEFFDVGKVFVFLPLVVLYVHGFTLRVGAVDRPLVHVHAFQIINDDGAHTFDDAVCLREFQIFDCDVERFYKITKFNCILALRVQKHLQVKLLIVGGVVVIYHRVSLFAQLYELCLQRFVLLHELFHNLHHVEFG